MLTVVALQAQATEHSQVPAVASALAGLARRQELAVVSARASVPPAGPTDHDDGVPMTPRQLVTALRAALPQLRLVPIAVAAAADPLADIERVGALLEDGALPLIFTPPGAADAVAATLADKLSATAVLRMVEPGLAGTATGVRRGGRRGARHAVGQGGRQAGG